MIAPLGLLFQLPHSLSFVTGSPSAFILDRNGAIKAKILGEAGNDSEGDVHEKMIKVLL